MSRAGRRRADSIARERTALQTGDARHGNYRIFYEKERADAYRSIAYAGHPAWALLRLVELAPPGLEAVAVRCREAVALYCNGYLAADAASNPFAFTPYGVFKNPEQAERQTFRDRARRRAGQSRRAFRVPAWRALAERQIQWTLGHNTLNRSLYNGIGYRQPVAYGFRVTQIPEGIVAGFIGRPDDTPYLEESFAIEWNTLEIWDVPNAHAINAISWL